jgi:O-acetylserine/cysteine efflux transporter
VLAVLGSFGWSVANVHLKRLKPTPHVVPLLFWPALISLLPLALLSAILESGQRLAMAQAHWTGWAGIAYSLFFSSLLGYGLWNRLIVRYPMRNSAMTAISRNRGIEWRQANGASTSATPANRISNMR